MKARSVKSILFIFLLVILGVSVISNYVCLSYLQNINEELIHKECDAISSNIRNEFEQRTRLLDDFSGKVYLELFRLDYFRNDSLEGRQKNQVTIRECIDLLNEFTEKQIHILIIDHGNNSYENYSRILSQDKLDIMKSQYKYMNEKKEADMEYASYQILNMEDAFWILKLQPFYISDYDTVENVEYGSIMAAVLIDKKELSEKFGLPRSLDVFVYDTKSGEGASELQEKEHSAVAIVSKNLEISNANYTVECVLQSGKDISGFEDIRAMIWVQLGVNILLAVLCMYALVRYIANPLNVIVQHMMSIDFGTKERLRDDFICSEINIVASQFNDLIDRLYERSRDAFYTQQRLYEMKLCEKERDMKALQSQINPHFIYNMLENIRVLAKMGRSEDVAEVTVQMANFLRYSLYINGFVTLEDELKATEAYLEVMRICYDNMFQVEYSIEEELMMACVPKMIIQPLVGNVFKHGFIFEHSNNLIKLKIKSDNSRIQISVFDNGIGINKTELDNLNKELVSSVLLEGDKGFGLYSINRRIKTIYGEEYGVSVTSSQNCENTYTNVMLSLPIWTEEDEDFVYGDFSR